MCVALTPARSRGVREEQWRADLRDGPEMGISPSSLLFGAMCSSVSARFHEVLYRGGRLLSHSTRGKNMKLALGLIGVAVAVVGGTVAGVHAAQPQASHRSQDSMTVGGYEGWWNATFPDGSSAGLPRETVTVSTRTGKIVDASNQARNRAGQSTSVSDVQFDVVPDPSWPTDSVVIIDTASGKVIESFPVDEKGRPVAPRRKAPSLPTSTRNNRAAPGPAMMRCASTSVSTRWWLRGCRRRRSSATTLTTRPQRSRTPGNLLPLLRCIEGADFSGKLVFLP